VSTDRVLRVKALRENVIKEKLRIEIFGPWRSDVNHNRPIEEDTQKKYVHFGGKRRLRFEFSEVRRPKEIVDVNLRGTCISRSRALDERILGKI
jgi:hypothetical protein